jgi:hypothetical protein
MEMKKVSRNSRVTLPKEFAGKYVYVEKIGEGVLRVETSERIPDSEKIFHTEEYRNRLKRFDQWMDEHAPDDSNTRELIEGKTR